MIKKILMLLTAVLLMGHTAVNAQRKIAASNTYVTEKRNVDSFDEIEISGSFEVQYKQSKGKPTVEIYAPDNIVPLVETQVKGKRLIIKPTQTIQHNGKVQITVSGPELEKVKVSGSGSIRLANGTKTGKNLTFEVRGSGKVVAEGVKCNLLYSQISGSGSVQLDKVKTNHAEATISGSGRMMLSGSSQSADVKVSGSGCLQATELKTAHADVRVTGSGVVSLYVSDTLKGSVSGSGQVSYKGNPEVTFSSKGLRKL